MVLRDEVVEDRGREQLFQTDVGLSGSPVKLRNRRRKPDDSISDKTIIAITAAWVVASFAFVALLPSILTRPSVESTAMLRISPAPEPRPAQLPAPALPAPVASESNSAAKTAPVLNTKGSVPSETQAAGRVTGAEVPVAGAGKVAATSRPAPTAAERAAVAPRGQELENTAKINAPRPPARRALTDEEKAAVERGLRELEKAAGQAQQ